MKRLDIEQLSPEWFEARLGIPTCSEFGRIITPKTGSLSAQADGYIADLLVELIDGPQEGPQSAWMERGIALEPEAVECYEFTLDVDTEACGLVLNKGAAWSPDRLVGTPGALEVKVPKPATHIKWLLADELPPEHKPQVHGALHIGELDWIDFMSYWPGFKPLIVRVTPDEYTEKVGEALAKFNERLKECREALLGDSYD